MVLSKYFVFIHFPKTGGSFVRKIFDFTAPKSWELSSPAKHLHISHCPDTHKSLPVIGFVRNPYDWYVSWYVFSKHVYPTDFFNSISDGGKLDFKSTMLSAMELDYNKIFEIDFNELYSRPVGAYTAYIHSMFGKDLDKVRLGKFENLREDFINILSEIVEPPLFMRLTTKLYPRVNVGKRSHYQDYYDPELREIIAEKEKVILDRFDYRFKDTEKS